MSLWVFQFSKFMLVGGVSTVLHYLVLIFLVDRLGIGPVEGSAIGYVCGGVLNYALNYKYTFASSKNHSETLYKFAIVVAIGFAINWCLMQALTEFTGLHYIASQIATTIFCMAWNFCLNKYWIFFHR